MQGRALSAIALCRTAALGGHQCVCLNCGQKEDPSYNSFRNRNCPKCQGLAQERWIAARTRAILPIPHFHAVFTLPAQLRPLARLHPVAIYDLMFRCVAATLLAMGQSRLGITLGLTMVLHTWTRKLTYHVHLHVLVTVGGLSQDGEAFTWQEELKEATGRDVTRCSGCGGTLFPVSLKATLVRSRRKPCRRTRSPP